MRVERGGGLRILDPERSEPPLQDGVFGLEARTAVVADPAPPRVAGRPGSTRARVSGTLRPHRPAGAPSGPFRGGHPLRVGMKWGKVPWVCVPVPDERLI
ncbi:hypothetical protein GCM10010287_13100 [Streptomyces variabilis]|uniref:Uncharacterized protein n=1 Tax=Streptomyces variabilis TaxID=67372 RepID=A0ABQ2TVH2_9ACTN|nr:hypothetical protein GCM10010265_24290 [Streptomyces griseoincarnatus]GGT41675.1 hypothetical protein GCM10010287_13100 [Streptomyces variabilis]